MYVSLGAPVRSWTGDALPDSLKLSKNVVTERAMNLYGSVGFGLHHFTYTLLKKVPGTFLRPPLVLGALCRTNYTQSFPSSCPQKDHSAVYGRFIVVVFCVVSLWLLASSQMTDGEVCVGLWSSNLNVVSVQFDHSARTSSVLRTNGWRHIAKNTPASISIFYSQH